MMQMGIGSAPAISSPWPPALHQRLGVSQQIGIQQNAFSLLVPKKAGKKDANFNEFRLTAEGLPYALHAH